MKSACVYILTNMYRTTFYIGVTSDIKTRIYQHRYQSGSGFTSAYKCYYLVYLENFSSIIDAIAREKQLKNWHRKWKINLIKHDNPLMVDFARDWFNNM